MKPKFFGQFLLENGYITENQLLDAINFQNQFDALKVGQVAIKNEYMTNDQVQSVNLEQRRKDKLFGELAVEMGYLTWDQLENSIDIQKDTHIYIGEALVELGHLTQEQLKGYLEEFHVEQKPLKRLEDIIPHDFDMRHEVFTLLDMSIKMFRRMASLYLKLGEGFFKTSSVENLYVCIQIGFTGSLDFTYFLNLPKNVAITMTRNLYGNKDMKCFDDTICDSIGELGNVICGNANTQMARLGHDSSFSVPLSFTYDETMKIDIPEGKRVLVFPGSVPIGYVEVGVIL